MNKKYCESLTQYVRFKTREIKVGELMIGGDNPIRVQSMTTTDTMDTIKTVEQSIRMIDAGCELVRITAPSINEAENLQNIKNELRTRGYNTPICADIHFTPNAAEVAARIVEKVRVNPGNYADKKKFETIDYTDAAYNAELERIREKFLPLVTICKQFGTAMRIGTNHGSLSDRIMSRYGDTPLGMVESAFEFLRIAEDENYFNIVLSMKASNPQVMVQAYRLLVAKMMETNRNYPLHLGVTEAGDGMDGRIKSAIGIGTLLEDGLGDTIRVSLTEDPELEIPVAQTIVKRYAETRSRSRIPGIKENPIDPFSYSRRKSEAVKNIGGHQVPVVMADFSEHDTITPSLFETAGYTYDQSSDKWTISEQAADYIFIGKRELLFAVPGTLGIIQNYKTWLTEEDADRTFPLYTVDEFIHAGAVSAHINFVKFSLEEMTEELIEIFKTEENIVGILLSSSDHMMQEERRTMFELLNEEIDIPVILHHVLRRVNEDELTLFASTDMGGLLIDGFGDGVYLEATRHAANVINHLCFGILQGTRTRISKTEYISCPSCGRTLFDLQETTQKIRSVTNHLKGVKIAIMGCIVNGPGEMADADYGYVGSGVGKITLYKGKDVMKRNVDAVSAVDELVTLIKENGDWKEN